MDLVELRFQIIGTTIPRNYHYCLYSAITNDCSSLKRSVNWRCGRISGVSVFNHDTLRLQNSYISIRCEKEMIKDLEPLYQRQLVLGKEALVSIALSEIVSVTPKTSLFAWVSIKTGKNKKPDLARFAVSLGKQLAGLNIDTLPEIGREETLIIKKEPGLVYPVSFENLRPDESISLQSQGVGGRSHLGCGFFE